MTEMQDVIVWIWAVGGYFIIGLIISLFYTLSSEFEALRGKCGAFVALCLMWPVWVVIKVWDGTQELFK